MTSEQLVSLRATVSRLGLGFVFAWFGAQELWQPQSWTGYVPAFLRALPQVQLILVHGYVLFALGLLLLLGQWTRPLAALAALLLLSIIGGLALDGGGTSLYIRDIGLMALAVSVMLEPAHLWGLDGRRRPSAQHPAAPRPRRAT